jgi:hypothetical protein
MNAGNDTIEFFDSYDGPDNNLFKAITSKTPSGKITAKSSFEWDSEQRVISASITNPAGDTINGSFNTTYNEKGFVKTFKSYELNKKQLEDLKVQYTYDKMGNWTQAVYFNFGKPYILLERTYKYY